MYRKCKSILFLWHINRVVRTINMSNVPARASVSYFKSRNYWQHSNTPEHFLKTEREHRKLLKRTKGYYCMQPFASVIIIDSSCTGILRYQFREEKKLLSFTRLSDKHTNVNRSRRKYVKNFIQLCCCL